MEDLVTTQELLSLCAATPVCTSVIAPASTFRLTLSDYQAIHHATTHILSRLIESGDPVELLGMGSIHSLALGPADVSQLVFLMDGSFAQRFALIQLDQNDRVATRTRRSKFLSPLAECADALGMSKIKVSPNDWVDHLTHSLSRWPSPISRSLTKSGTSRTRIGH